MGEEVDRSEWHSRMRRLAVAAFSLALTALVALVDFATGYETSVSILYMAPIVVAAWYSWRYAALLVALLSGVSDSVLNFAAHKPYSAINTLNSAIQCSFFTVFAYLLLALKEAQGKLTALSRTDPLTATVNRRYFFEIGNAEMQREQRYNHPFSVIYMDVDDFKIVNDGLGHGAGDALLKEMAAKVRRIVRRTDTVARLGGDEFAILMPEADSEAAKTVVARIRDVLVEVSTATIGKVSCSIGVVTHTGSPSRFDEIVKEADALMYEAKRDGKNAVRYKIMAGPTGMDTTHG